MTPLDIEQGETRRCCSSVLGNALVDADCAAGNPIKTKTILAGDVRIGPPMSAEAVRINRADADEKRKRHRPDCNPADQLFGKSKLPPEQAVDGRADQG